MKLPKMIFVRWNDDVNGPPFLEASLQAKDLAEQDETIEVGIYELTSVKKLVNKSEIE